MTSGQILGYSCKLGGITVQTSYVKGKVGGIKIERHVMMIMMIKIERTRARNFFLQTYKEICEKRKFFVNRSITEKGTQDPGQREHFSGAPRTQLSEYLYERGVQKFVG